MRLVDLPKDVLEHILCLLQVKDVLAAERTCKSLRSVTTTRHLWLVLLQQLKQCHAPDLPLHVGVEQLSYEELRSAVTRAILWHETCKKGLATSPETRISSATLSVHQHFEYMLYLNLVQLSPDGNYLIMYCQDEGFSVSDVATGERVCQWADEDDGINHSFALHSRSDDLIFILLTCWMRNTDVPNTPILLRLLHFDLRRRRIIQVKKICVNPRGPNADRCSLCDALNDSVGVTGIHELSELIVPSFLVWTWESNRVVEVILDPGQIIEKVHIMHGHLFFIVEDYPNSRLSVGAIALEQLAQLETAMIHIGNLKRLFVVLKDASQTMFRFFPRMRVYNFALYDSARVRNTIEGYVAVGDLDTEERMKDILVYRLIINLRDTGNGGIPIASPVVQSTMKTVQDMSNNNMRFLPTRRNRRSGQTVVGVADSVTSGWNYPIDGYYLVGPDEDDKTFLCPLFQSTFEGPVEARFEENSGAIVLFVRENGSYRIDVHHIPRKALGQTN